MYYTTSNENKEYDSYDLLNEHNEYNVHDYIYDTGLDFEELMKIEEPDSNKVSINNSQNINSQTQQTSYTLNSVSHCNGGTTAISCNENNAQNTSTLFFEVGDQAGNSGDDIQRKKSFITLAQEDSLEVDIQDSVCTNITEAIVSKTQPARQLKLDFSNLLMNIPAKTIDTPEVINTALSLDEEKFNLLKYIENVSKLVKF